MPESPRIAVRLPDHLGDGVMATGAVRWLAEQGRVRLTGPSWAPAVFQGLDVGFAERLEGDVAVLLKPSFRAAWQALRVAERVGLATDFRRPLLTTAVAAAEEHRVLEYRRVARAAMGVVAAGSGAPSPQETEVDGSGIDDAFLPRWSGVEELPEWARDFGPRSVLVLPGTKSAATVRWPKFAGLVSALGERACVVGGPGDEDIVAQVGGVRGRAPLGVAEIATLARKAWAVVGNDSGLSHLAAAARRGSGQDVAAVHVVYGSTDPARTGPPGSTPHAGTRPPCWPCYQKRCPIGTPCLDVPVERVLEALA